MRAADTARAAFAIGWALATAQHPVPLTTRAVAACTAAMRLMEADPLPSGEPTLKLGQLEGIWAVIYERREAIEKLHAKALEQVTKAIKRLDWSVVIGGLERWLLLNPVATRAQVAARLGVAVEQFVAAELPVDTQAAWRTAMHAALLDATAEGEAASLAQVGHAAGIVLDFDLAAKEAKAALADNRVLWDQSSGWMAKQAHGLAYQVSQRLATLWDDGATAAEMERSVADLLDIGTAAAGVVMDQAIGTAISWGALTTYQDAGVQYSDFVTAGDSRVCPQCEQAEEESPYSLYDAPLPPLHPGCRCTLAPSDYQPSDAALRLLAPYTSEEEAA